jgi:hypothetical protein
MKSEKRSEQYKNERPKRWNTAKEGEPKVARKVAEEL